MKLKLFDIQRFSVHDGPGIRTSVFLKGCVLRCKWCHNPESISSQQELLYYAEKCIHCGKCTAVCPTGAQLMAAGVHQYRRGQCIHCGACQEVCPAGALEVAGYVITPEQLLAKISRDRIFYDQTGGGVTFTGGEPLAQAKVLLPLIKLCKEEGIHTAVETCLMVPETILESILPYLDLWICDMKTYSSSLHKQYTGAENHQIKSNLKYLADRCAENMWVRIPFISGVNDQFDEMGKMAEFLAPYPFARVEVMPYHDIGVSKYTALGQIYSLAEEKLFTAEDTEVFREILRSGGVRNVI